MVYTLLIATFARIKAKVAMENKEEGEIVLYQPDEEVKLEVRLEDETVWLTQMQMAELFETSKQNVSLHTNNIFKEKELDADSVVKESLTTAADGKKYRTKYYNLDVIISVGYRVKSIRGTQFRRWATGVLKDYMLKGYALNQRLNHIEQRMDEKFMRLEHTVAEHGKQIDFFVRTSLPPMEGVFCDGRIFDAYKFAADLIRSARKSLVLIDNYVDESVLTLLSKRAGGVIATIYTARITPQLQLDLDRHNDQYPPVDVRTCSKCHDRFLIIDNRDIYHIGASLKDLGRKMFAFSRLAVPLETVTDWLR